MTGFMPEKFIFSFYFWLIIVLLVGVTFSIAVLIRRKYKKPDEVRVRKRPIRTVGRRRISKTGSAFTEKLGEKVVRDMIEVSRSKDRNVIKQKISDITKECTRLSKLPIPRESKEIVSTVLVWAQNFDIDSHINDLTVFNHSSQIIYDHQKRDFKLMIRQN